MSDQRSPANQIKVESYLPATAARIKLIYRNIERKTIEAKMEEIKPKIQGRQ